MNYAKIVPCDLANGKGVRVSLFVSGCKFYCPECFNAEAQDYNYGDNYSEETEAELLKLIKNPTIDGLSILGGDPMWQDIDGMKKLQSLAYKVYDMGKSIWIWTGFTFEEIIDAKEKAYKKLLFNITDKEKLSIARYNLMSVCDVLVDGTFIEKLKDPSLAFRGSSNQRVIDIQKSLKSNSVILYEI